jgi:hypothetical protein
MSIDAIFGQFNAADVEPQAARGLIEPGWYPAMISKTSTKINKAGTGSYLELEFEILDGPNKNRRVWDRLNLDNPSQTAVEIAKSALSAICHSVGVLTPKTPEELKDRPLEIMVGIQPAKGEYGESNVIKGYRKTGAEGVAKHPFRRMTEDDLAAKVAGLAKPNDDLPF